MCQCDTQFFLCPHLTHWGWVMHIFISKLTIIGLDNGLLPVQHQAIIWTNASILLIRTLGTDFSEILKIFIDFHSRNCIWKCLQNGCVSDSMCWNNHNDIMTGKAFHSTGPLGWESAGVLASNEKLWCLFNVDLNKLLNKWMRWWLFEISWCICENNVMCA